MDNTQRARDRGHQAKRLLEDELFIEAFDEVKRAITTRWETDLNLTPEDRERLWMSLYTLNKVHSYIETVLRDGKLADHELQQIMSERSTK